MRNCMDCKQCIFDEGSQGFSEMTPSTKASWRCRKDLWYNKKKRHPVCSDSIMLDEIDRRTLTEIFRMAETCPNYEFFDWTQYPDPTYDD